MVVVVREVEVDGVAGFLVVVSGTGTDRMLWDRSLVFSMAIQVPHNNSWRVQSGDHTMQVPTVRKAFNNWYISLARHFKIFVG